MRGAGDDRPPPTSVADTDRFATGLGLLAEVGVAVCCGLPLLVGAGALAAAGGFLRNPLVIAAGVVLMRGWLAGSLAAVARVRRPAARRRPPAWPTASTIPRSVWHDDLARRVRRGHPEDAVPSPCGRYDLNATVVGARTHEEDTGLCNVAGLDVEIIEARRGHGGNSELIRSQSEYARVRPPVATRAP